MSRRRWRVICADAITGLKKLKPGSVHCVVTSPPYFGLRDYGMRGQVGVESTPDEYVASIVAVFREIKRVLHSTGTAWLVIGDCYASSWPCRRRSRIGAGALPDGRRRARPPRLGSGVKDKDLIGIPWRVAFALQADGWWLRQDNIWQKPNPMPESVTDRCTKAHEYVFLLTRDRHYFYDHEAVKEDAVGRDPGNKGHEGKRAYDAGDRRHRTKAGFVNAGAVAKRNKRSVWTVAVKPFKGAHFAVYPPELIKPCILAGTSERGVCSRCGAPWKRIVKKTRTFESGSGRSGNMPRGKHGPKLQGGGETKDIRRGPCVTSKTTGWKPTCKCRKGREPAIVLDPFCGSGTTGEVALKHGRRFIGIELNPEYAEMSRERIRAAAKGGGA